MTSGFYVMGRYQSVAWCKTRGEAERIATKLNYRGGTHYTVEPGDKLGFADLLPVYMNGEVAMARRSSLNVRKPT